MTVKHLMPLVDIKDDGIRPAGKPDECFFCNQKVGNRHKSDCVVVNKRVKIKYEFIIEVDLPHFWEKENFEFHRNEGTWCSGNSLGEIEQYLESEDSCGCDVMKATYLEVTDNTPKRKIREHT